MARAAAIGDRLHEIALVWIAIDADQIGKIYSFRYTLSRTAGALGMALAVPVYAWLGARSGIAAGGVILACYAVFALARTSQNATSTEMLS